MERDEAVVLRTAVERGMWPVSVPSYQGHQTGVILGKTAACPAWVMDPDQWGRCEGRWRIDHVKDQVRLGRKAPDDIDHLIALCAAHDERGMRGGEIWNTAHRDLERKYLRDRRQERDADPGS